MDKSKDRLSIDVARLYYESDMSQQDIARELNISRPTVSRLLQYAKDCGFVEVRINDPNETQNMLKEALKNKYHLDDVQVVNVALNTKEEITKTIGLKAAQLLQRIVKNGDIIGVGWGTTLYQMAQCLQNEELKGVQIIQLKGGISYSHSNTYANEIVSLMAQAFSAKAIYMPLPVMFDSVEVKNLVVNDKFVSRILDRGRQANIAVVTVGSASSDSLLFHLGYYIDDNDRHIISRKAVGDLCSRFYNEEGKIVDKAIDDRTVGISLDEFRQKETRILAAGGKDKVKAIQTALKHGYANVLVTDRYTAKSILKVQ